MVDDKLNFIDAINDYEQYTGRDTDKWRRLKKRMLRALSVTTEYDDIRPFCENGRDIDLPDEVAFGAYERLIQLGCDEPIVYKLYSSRLWMSGPEFDEKAEEMQEIAKRLAAD